jgi:GTPase SAR1 family protein
MPSKHLWRDDLVQQAIHITEAAILVYDITSEESLRLTTGLHDLIRDTIGTREYGLTLMGNKSDCDDGERQVSWAEGSKAATAMQVRCAFMEVSAKNGDGIPNIFPQVCTEILKLKWINQQRKDQAEQAIKLRQQEAVMVPKRRKGLWKRLSPPWFRRQVAQT